MPEALSEPALYDRLANYAILVETAHRRQKHGIPVHIATMAAPYPSVHLRSASSTSPDATARFRTVWAVLPTRGEGHLNASVQIQALFVSAAHSEADIARMAEAIEASFAQMARDKQCSQQ